MDSSALLLRRHQCLASNADLVLCFRGGSDESSDFSFGSLERCTPSGELLTKLSALGISLAHIGKSCLNFLGT
jgi:hypothetical protein